MLAVLTDTYLRRKYLLMWSDLIYVFLLLESLESMIVVLIQWSKMVCNVNTVVISPLRAKMLLFRVFATDLEVRTDLSLKHGEVANYPALSSYIRYNN